MIQIPMSFYHDPSEQLRGVLGQNYVSTIISEKKVSRSLMVLTDRRLYQTGKVYERGLGNQFISSTGKKAVSVKDITGTAFREINNVSLLVSGWVFLGIALLAIVCAPDNRRGEYHLGGLIFLCFMSGCATCFVMYYMSRQRWFIIEYAGGAIATRCKWYSPDEIEEFQRKISLEKDRIAEEMQGKQPSGGNKRVRNSHFSQDDIFDDV